MEVTWFGLGGHSVLTGKGGIVRVPAPLLIGRERDFCCAKGKSTSLDRFSSASKKESLMHGNFAPATPPLRAQPHLLSPRQGPTRKAILAHSSSRVLCLLLCMTPSDFTVILVM